MEGPPPSYMDTQMDDLVAMLDLTFVDLPDLIPWEEEKRLSQTPAYGTTAQSGNPPAGVLHDRRSTTAWKPSVAVEGPNSTVTTFLSHVQEHFSSRRDVFDAILRAFDSCKKQQISSDECWRQVNYLLQSAPPELRAELALAWHEL